MRVVPKLDGAAITYFEIHAPVWQENHAAIGLTEAQAVQVADLAAAAQAARAAQYQAHEAARAATSAYHSAVARLRAAGSACLAQIRATAADEGEAVYIAASVPIPDKPGRLPAPGTPSRLSAQFHGGTGTIRLSWRCKSPGPGTLYEIRRCDSPDGPNPVIAVTGKKHFDDDTIPPGTPLVTYTVTSLRTTRRGQPATHTVYFGTAPGSATFTFQAAAA